MTLGYVLPGQGGQDIMLTSRWFILAVLFFARFALGYHFQSAGSAAPYLIHDLAMDYAQAAVLVGAFIFPGVVVSVPSGFLVQRLGDKNVAMSAMALMVIGGLVAAITSTYVVILVARTLSGIGGAILIVVMLKMVTDWFAGKELFLGMAIFIIAWPAGIAAGQSTQSTLAELQSWHLVFSSSAILVALALLLVMLFYHAPPAPDRAASAARIRLSKSQIGMVCLAGAIWMFLNGAYLVMLSFGPAQLIERGMTIARAESAVSLMSWVCILAMPLGGYIATRYGAPNFVMVGGLAASTLLGALIPFSRAPLSMFALYGIALALATPVVGALPAEVLEPQTRGPGMGIYYLWYFGGMPIFISLAGVLTDQTGSATASLIFATSMMLCCLVLLGVFRFAQTRWSIQLRQ
jgi:MFS family permease